MSFFPPLFYLVSIFSFLSVILTFIIRQTFSIQLLNDQLKITKQEIKLNQISQSRYLTLGQIYLKKQLYDNALKIFQKCLVRWNRNDKLGLIYLYTTISFIYLKLNFQDFAQFYLEQAVFTSPTFSITLNNLIYLYQQRNLRKKYIEIFIYKNFLEKTI